MSLEAFLSSAAIPGLCAALALAGCRQAAIARTGVARLFGLAVAFLGVAAVFALGAQAPGGRGDPAGEAAALCVLVLGLGWLGLGAGLALRRREATSSAERGE